MLSQQIYPTDLKAMAISSSNLVKCEPDCLLHSSATPMT